MYSSTSPNGSFRQSGGDAISSTSSAGSFASGDLRRWTSCFCVRMHRSRNKIAWFKSSVQQAHMLLGSSGSLWSCNHRKCCTNQMETIFLTYCCASDKIYVLQHLLVLNMKEILGHFIVDDAAAGPALERHNFS